MKNSNIALMIGAIIILVVAGFFVFSNKAEAATLQCAPDEVIVNVEISPEIPAVPEVPEVGHWEYVSPVFGTLSCNGPTQQFFFGLRSCTWVVDTPAVPEVPSIPAVFEEQCHTDPDYKPPVVVPTTPAPQTQVGGGGPPWCSGPIAPGWNVSLPNGGCHNSPLDVFMKAGTWYKGEFCPRWYSMGCIFVDHDYNITSN